MLVPVAAVLASCIIITTSIITTLAIPRAVAAVTVATCKRRKGRNAVFSSCCLRYYAMVIFYILDGSYWTSDV